MELAEDFRVIARQIGNGNITNGVRLALEEAAKERDIWPYEDPVKMKRLGKNESLLWRNIDKTGWDTISMPDFIKIAKGLGMNGQSRKLLAHIIDKGLLVKKKDGTLGINRGALDYVEVKE